MTTENKQTTKKKRVAVKILCPQTRPFHSDFQELHGSVVLQPREFLISATPER